MFDRFEPFKKLDKTITFTFTPSRFETWFEGNMVDSGQTKLPIYFVPIVDEGEERIRVMLFDSKILDQMENNTAFDEFISSSDRLQLVTLPASTETGCMGISMLKLVAGHTRDSKEFSDKEPYCCNLFLIEGKLSKVTFAFSNPEKLLELYL